MPKKNRVIVMAVILMLSVINFSRIKGNENIRPVQYLSLLAIGALVGLLLNELVTLLRARRQ